MLSWEYPPVLVGGLGRHVHALAAALAAAGHEVTVVTRHADGAPARGVRRRRPHRPRPRGPGHLPARHRLPAGLDHGVQPHPHPGRPARHRQPAPTTSSTPTTGSSRTPPSPCASTSTSRWSPPSTPPRPAGTRAGCPEEMNRTIHGVEHWLSNASARVIACSGYMREQVTRLFDVPAGQVDVVPNGVDDRAWRARPRAVALGPGPVRRGRPAGRVRRPAGLREGRAAPGARRAAAARPAPRAAGGDRRRRPVPGRAGGRRPGGCALEPTVRFAGFLDADPAARRCSAPPTRRWCRASTSRSAWSRWRRRRPARRWPWPRTGGLAEIVEPGVTGVTFPHSDPGALAGAVDRLLGDEVFARRVARRARTMVGERYGWATIAARTAGSYATARREHGPFAGPARRRPAGRRARRGSPSRRGTCSPRADHAAC